MLNITVNQDILSLPYLRRLNKHNVELIKECDKDIDTNLMYRLALIVGILCCATICIGMTYLHLSMARRFTAQLKKVIAEITSGGINPKGGVVNISKQRTSR